MDIENAGGVEESEVLEAKFKKEVKAGTKDVHLTFYREVVQCFEEVSAHNTDGNCIVINCEHIFKKGIIENQ